jgi:copper/silver efflux system protein
MLNHLLEAAVQKRKIVITFFCFLALLAFWSFQNIKIDAIPDLGENQQIVFTEWAGRSAKDIEDQITYPLSVDLQGIPGVKNVRGMSTFGFSMIFLIFEDDVDFYWSRTRVLERLSSLAVPLPEGANPSLGPDATGLGQVLWYSVENTEESLNPLSLDKLRSLQDFYVRYLLQGASGVSEVASIGGFVKEYQIDVDPNKLFAFHVSFKDLLQAIRSSNVDVGAELIEEGEREMIIRGVGLFRTLEDIEDVVITVREGTPIRVRDVAQVGTGPAFRRGVLDRDGQEIVGGVVTMRYGENPQEVIDAVKEKLQIVEQGLPQGVEIKIFYDRTELIQNTLGTVYQALSTQAIITVLVILFFLLHFQSSILVSLTLPFGIGFSFLVMYFLGIDSNIMSLAGLVISIGVMVDMGIIMTENIYSRLSENPDLSRNQKLVLIQDSVKEVGPAILIAVMTTIVTFLPVFALQGAEGKLFVPLAWTKTIAMLGSVLVALFLVPALSHYFLKGRLRPLEENTLSREIISNYRQAAEWVLTHRKKFLILPLIIVIFGAFAFSRLGSEFMPQLNEGDIMYMPVTTPDVSMTKARELLSYTDQVISEHPLVEYSVGKLGRAESALDPAPVEMFETIVRLKPMSEWPRGMTVYDVINELDQSLQIPGVVNSWGFPIQIRIGMISTGIRTPVGIKIFGSDQDELERLSGKVARVVETVPGARGVYEQQISGKPYVEFHVDRVAASRYGLNSGDINTIIQTAMGGMAVSQFYEGRERYPVRVRYQKELRDNLEELKSVLIPTPGGQHIPISQVTTMQMTTGPSVIQSEDGFLRSLVTLNVDGRDLVGFVEEARERVAAEVNLPSGYSIHWAGQYEDQVRATNRLKVLVPLILLINLFLIFLGIKNWALSGIVFSAIPVALSGAMIFLWAGGMNTSVAVWVGCIALFGIAVDDGVVMMKYLIQKMEEMKPTSFEELKQTIIEAGARRIRPLLMTTVTTLFALTPVLLAVGTGAEVMKPMALPIFGGMLFVFISVFMVPVIFSFYMERNLTQELNRGEKSNDQI